MGGSKRAIVGGEQSGSEISDSIRPGTGWVEGSERPGSRFDQNRVGGSD